MADQEPQLDPSEALLHLRVRRQVAADSEDIDQIERILAEAQRIINKALPRKQAGECQSAFKFGSDSLLMKFEVGSRWFHR